MSFQLNNNKFKISLTEPLFNILNDLNFKVNEASNSFSHNCSVVIPFTHVEQNLETRNELHQIYTKFFTEVADKIETIVLNIKDELGPIDISETFSSQYIKTTSEIVEKLLSGNKNYLLFLNDYEPEIDSMGDKFVELTSKFAITRRNNETLTKPTFICIVEVQEWEVNKVNPALADKKSVINIFVMD